MLLMSTGNYHKTEFSTLGSLRVLNTDLIFFNCLYYIRTEIVSCMSNCVVTWIENVVYEGKYFLGGHRVYAV